jgi:hypothetical protein
MTSGADADVYVRFREMNRFARVNNMGAEPSAGAGRCQSLPDVVVVVWRRWMVSEPSTTFAVSYSAARFGVNSSGNPL